MYWAVCCDYLCKCFVTTAGLEGQRSVYFLHFLPLILNIYISKQMPCLRLFPVSLLVSVIVFSFYSLAIYDYYVIMICLEPNLP